MALAVVIILLVIGSVIFHFASPWWFTPIASNWGYIDDTVNLTFWVTGFVFVAVNLFVAYAVIKFRYRKDRRATYEPEDKKLEWWLTGITTVGVVAMLAPGLFVWADFVTVPEGASRVEAVSQQWTWSFRLPGKDGEFGTTDARIITVDNPFGLHADDPNGQDDILVLSPELHLPIDQPVKVLLRSKDVLHNFTVPQFRVKMDMVPGMVSYLWLTPTRTGEFEILCEELCGIAHFAMRGRVVVDEEADFQVWLDKQPTFAETMARTGGDAAAGQALYLTCAACHGQQGEGVALLNSPKLSGMQSWYLKRQLVNYRDGSRGKHADDIFGQQMAPMVTTLSDDAALDNVVAYIGTLPDNPAPATVAGNATRGEDLYTTCAACHGADGQGRWGTFAPRQAGMSDWYMARQLQNFKQGIRGGHRDDLYGAQMVMMSKVLADDEAINDIVAYINTL